MADYMREIIYLKKTERGLVGEGGGFARLSLRKKKMTVYLSMEGKGTDVREKIYLIYRRHGILLPFSVGTTDTGEVTELEISVENSQGMPAPEEICGIFIGDAARYWSGTCKRANRDISYEQIYFTGKEEEKKEIVSEAQTIEPEPVQELKPESEPEREPEPEPVQELKPEPVEEPESVRAASLENMPAQEPEKLRDPFLARLAEMYPFEDDEMAWCRQIEPSDFSSFPMEFWHYSRNSFLLQGFYNYRHLLYAHGKEKNYIGVPGQFHRREQYLANRFGFPRFKGTKKKRVTVGDFGYWLKEL